jgi:hypothetical protein
MVPDVALLDDLRSHVRRARRCALAARDRVVANPVAVTGVLASLLLAYAAYRLFAPLPAGTWPELKDSVIFEYIGWYIAEGNRLYLDVWEVKPPLTFEVTAILALLAGDNVVLYHVLNLLANGAAIVVGAMAAAGIVFELTDDPLGAVVGGLVPFAMPYYFYRALVGFKSKYFVVAAGLLCLYLAYRDRPVAAGVAGAVAFGFWQLALIFPVGALGLVWQERGRDAARRFVAAGLATGTVIVLPVLVWGAFPSMIAEVFFTPLLTPDDYTYTDRIQYVIRVMRKTLPVALIGLLGLAEGLAPGRVRREWPLALAVGWFTVTMIELDFDRQPDLFPWFAVVAVGVGLAVSHGRRWVGRSGDVDSRDVVRAGSRALAAAMLLMATLSVVTMGGYGTGNTGMTDPDTFDTGTEMEPELKPAKTYNATERQYVFWNRQELPNCRALGGYTQYQLVQRLPVDHDGPWYEVPCGQFDPAWRAVRDEYGI